MDCTIHRVQSDKNRQSAREVDFVVDRGKRFEKRFELYEAKWTEHPDASDTKQLAHVIEVLGAKQVLSAQIVCPTPNRYPIRENIEAVGVADLVDEPAGHAS